MLDSYFPNLKKNYFPILEHVMGRPIHELLLDDSLKINEVDLSTIFTLMDRLDHGEPVQYITGISYFYKDQFYVNRGVLIPRPESEYVVEYVLKWMSDKKTPESLNICDMCTGSGCIGISISKYASVKHHLWLVDISKNALKTAGINVKRLINEDKNIDIMESDLLEVFTKNTARVIDILIANPPYIPSSRIMKLERNVKDFEPHLALDGGEDGTDLITRLLIEAQSILKEDGLIIMEIDETQGKKLTELSKKLYPKKHVKIEKDLADKDRYLIIS